MKFKILLKKKKSQYNSKKTWNKLQFPNFKTSYKKKLQHLK